MADETDWSKVPFDQVIEVMRGLEYDNRVLAARVLELEGKD